MSFSPSPHEQNEDAAPEVKQTLRDRRPGPITFAVLAILVVVARVFTIFAVNHRSQQNQSNQLLRVSGIPSSVSTSLANLMTLSPVPPAAAAPFTLTDQYGHTTSLSDFRGRAVVLEFMDTHCTDICPLVSQEFVDAYHDLGSEAPHVVFLAINVNKYHARVADVAAFSQEHQLNTIPTWHFMTGSLTSLQKAWRNYGIDVVTRGPHADIIHSSFIFFIDPQGRERYLGNPTDQHTPSGTSFLPANQLSAWGKGISLVARSLVG